jgi:hypothetical protein
VNDRAQTRPSVVALTTWTLLVWVAACGRGTDAKNPTVETGAKVARTAPQNLGPWFAAPESALYDAEQDVYFVSNINGGPLDKDDNGYISRIRPDGGGNQPNWIDGARPDITLNAPKGMAITGGDLWVADIDVVRRFDRRSGAPRGEVAIPGSLFLNDIDAAPDGTLYVSDTGIALDSSGPVPKGADAIYRIAPDGKVEKILEGEELHQPNGVAVVGDQIWVVTYGDKELFQIVDGKKQVAGTLPKGQLDGLLHLADGSFLISSWEASGIYGGPAAGPFELVVQNVPAPADIGFDSKRGLLLVPHLMENQVTLHPIAVTPKPD